MTETQSESIEVAYMLLVQHNTVRRGRDGSVKLFPVYGRRYLFIEI